MFTPKDSFKGQMPTGKPHPLIVGRHVIAVPITATDADHAKHVAADRAKEDAEREKAFAAEKAKAEAVAEKAKADAAAAAPSADDAAPVDAAKKK